MCPLFPQYSSESFLFHDFPMLNWEMWMVNTKMTQPHHWSSRYYQWVVNARGLAYWSGAKDTETDILGECVCCVGGERGSGLFVGVCTIFRCSVWTAACLCLCMCICVGASVYVCGRVCPELVVLCLFVRVLCLYVCVSVCVCPVAYPPACVFPLSTQSPRWRVTCTLSATPLLFG